MFLAYNSWWLQVFERAFLIPALCCPGEFLVSSHPWMVDGTVCLCATDDRDCVNSAFICIDNFSREEF